MGRQRKRVCSRHGCPTVYPASEGPYCATDRRAAEAIRGSARQRGYDKAHERRRVELLPEAEGKPCPRCEQPMHSWQRLQLGHTRDRAIDPSSRADRIEHADCNELAGGQAGAAYRE